jgi:hypothetical protein
MRRNGRFAILLVIAGVAGASLGGCAGWTAGKHEPAHPLLMDPATLDQLTMAYADRYVLLISAATDSIKARSTDLRQQHSAQKLKTESAMSVYDIVTTGDAYGRLLDLTVAVTLQSNVYIDEDEAEKEFGKELSPELIRAMRQARIEIWEIAGKALTPEQLDNLDLLIWDYRRTNPMLLNVINVRFKDFANSKTKSLVADASASGIFGQIDEARQEVEEARRLAEQAFFYGKRAPLLLSWQAETSADDMLAKPEVVQMLADLHQFGSLAETFPEIVAKEREAIAGKYMPPPSTQPGASGSASATVVASTQPAVSARPFDVREYTAALAQATEAVKELNSVLQSSRSLLDSPAWSNRITEIQESTDGRIRLATEHSEALVAAIFLRVYIAIGALFVALVAYRLVAIALVRRMAHVKHEKGAA